MTCQRYAVVAHGHRNGELCFTIQNLATDERSALLVRPAMQRELNRCARIPETATPSELVGASLPLWLPPLDYAVTYASPRVLHGETTK